MTSITFTMHQLQSHIRQLLIQAGVPIKTITAKLEAMYQRLRTTNLKEKFKFTSFLALFREVRGAIGAQLRAFLLSCKKVLRLTPAVKTVTLVETVTQAAVVTHIKALTHVEASTPVTAITASETTTASETIIASENMITSNVVASSDAVIPFDIDNTPKTITTQDIVTSPSEAVAPLTSVTASEVVVPVEVDIPSATTSEAVVPVEEEPTCTVTTSKQEKEHDIGTDEVSTGESSTDNSSVDDSSVDESDSVTSDNSTAASDHSVELTPLHKHQKALAALVGPKDARRILTGLKPDHVGQYNRNIGGMYTGPIKDEEVRRQVHNILYDIYPRALPPNRDNVWHSTNFQTGQIWIGVPRSVPVKDMPMHKRQWAVEHERKERQAKKLQSAASTRAVIQRLAKPSGTSTTTQATPGTWAAIATVDSGPPTAAQIAESHSTMNKKMEDWDAAQAAIPAPTYTTTYRPQRVKTVEAPKAPRAAGFVPPHLRHAQKVSE